MILFWVTLALLVVIVLISLHNLLTINFSKKSTIDSSGYECGYFPKQLDRLPFDLQFYLIGLLFVVFDIEIGFCIPFCLVFFFSGVGGFYTVCFFLLLFGLALIVEFKENLIRIKNNTSSMGKGKIYKQNKWTNLR